MQADSQLSCYILTRNSERRLAQVLEALGDLVDDLMMGDSGSSERTGESATRFGARFAFRRFDDFRRQRAYALSLCRCNWVLELDSDEVVSPALRERLRRIKASGFAAAGGPPPDAYGIRR